MTEKPDSTSSLQACRQCGCTELNACEGPCYWVEDDLCSECAYADQDDEEPFDFGPCCICGKRDRSVRNVLMLSRRVPDGKGNWGCFECGLPLEGAGAVVCDECLPAFQEHDIEALRWFCGSSVAEERRPIEELGDEPFEHDLWRHGDVPKRLGQMPLEAWQDAADRCQWCRVRYQVRIVAVDRAGNFGDVEWQAQHGDDCPEFAGETSSDYDDAGWTFASTSSGVEGVELGGRFYPVLRSRANVGPCLRCWRLAVDGPISMFVGDPPWGELVFCQGCLEVLMRTGALKLS